MQVMENKKKQAVPDTKELRSFGLLVGGIFAFVFGLALPVWRQGNINLWFWCAGCLIILGGVAVPSLLSPFYSAWMRLGHVLGWINTRIILGVFFYGILCPAGMLMRLSGKDPMHRNFESDADSYRVASRIPPSTHFERPF